MPTMPRRFPGKVPVRARGPKPAPAVRRPVPVPARPAPASVRPIAQTLVQAQAALPALRREAEELLAVVERCKAHIGTDFYEMSRALTELLDRKLYAAVDYPTFAAMLEDRRLISPAVASKLIAIYRGIPRRTALQLGPNRSYEWLQLLRAEAGPKAEPADVRQQAGTQTEVAGRPVVELSTRDLAELRRSSQVRRDAGRRDPDANEAHRLARALAQRLAHLGAADARVTARYGKGGWRLRADFALAAGRALLGKIS